MNGRKAKQLRKLAAAMSQGGTAMELPKYSFGERLGRSFKIVGKMFTARHEPMSARSIYKRLKRSYTRRTTGQ